MWFIVALIFFIPNEAQPIDPFHFSSRSNSIPTFVINGAISHNLLNRHSAAHIIRGAHTFQQQAYERNLAHETTKLLALCHGALQKQENIDQEGFPIVYNTQEAVIVNQNNNHASHNSNHPSISSKDVEQYAVKQSQEELKHLAVLVEEYERPDEYHNNLLAFDHITSRQQRRHKALQATLADGTRFEKHYELTQDVTFCIQQHAIQKALFTHCTGTHIQQALHEEFLELIEEMPIINERLRKKGI